MMRFINFKMLVLLLTLMPLLTSAQSSTQKKNDLIVVLIKKHIEERRADLIYAMGNKAYQATISQKEFEDAGNGIYILGKIKKSFFIRAEKGVNKYKLAFEAGNLELSFATDQHNKLKKLSFLPFQPVVTKKTVLVPAFNPLKSKLDKEVDTFARLYIQNSNTVGLSIGVIRDGETYTYGYGTTQKKNGVTPDANTIFEIGSISKTFTAQLLAYYVNSGKISLADPITKYLPDSVAANPELQKIKIVNLSNHTSGLVRLPENILSKNLEADNPYKNYTTSLLFDYLKTAKLVSVPGEVYSYSNIGTGLLGVILERISGKNYEQLVKEIIAGPLKMNSTFQHLTPEFAKRFTKVYNDEGMEIKAWDLDALVGAGGLRSTVNDLLIYAKNNMEHKDTDLSKAFELTHQVTFSKEPMVGLGWHIIQSADEEAYYWHNGSTGGSRSFIMMDLKKKTAVIVLSNSNVENDTVGVRIFEKL